MTMGGNFVSVGIDTAKTLIAAADINKETPYKIVPRGDLKDEDFQDIWWIGDYSEINIDALKSRGYEEIVNTLFTDEWYSKEKMIERGVAQIPLCFLAKILENMSLCHAAYFCKGWEHARGCKIEHDAAAAYGLDIIYEE